MLDATKDTGSPASSRAHLHNELQSQVQQTMQQLEVKLKDELRAQQKAFDASGANTEACTLVHRQSCCATCNAVQAESHCGRFLKTHIALQYHPASTCHSGIFCASMRLVLCRTACRQ